jgi:iron-sulfur cluster assembly accessory protein
MTRLTARFSRFLEAFSMAEQIASEHPINESPPQGIQLTPKALEMVRQMYLKEGPGPDSGLRVGVVGGGCSGFQYTLNFDAQKEGDAVTIIDGMKVLVDELSIPYVAGTTLDYVEGLHNAGFRFDNPRASRVCGCGSSFSA